jgi:hypothetical protein
MQRWILRLLAGGIFAGSAMFGQGPFISQSGIMNRASQIPVNLPGGALAPGAMIQIRGQNLGPVDTVYSNGFPLRTRLGDLQTRVLANGSIECPLFSVAEDVISAQLPADLTDAQASLRVVTSEGESVDITVPLVAGNFGMFTQAANGLGLASCQTIPCWPTNLSRPIHLPSKGRLSSAMAQGWARQIRRFRSGKPRRRRRERERNYCSIPVTGWRRCSTPGGRRAMPDWIRSSSRFPTMPRRAAAFLSEFKWGARSAIWE